MHCFTVMIGNFGDKNGRFYVINRLRYTCSTMAYCPLSSVTYITDDIGVLYLAFYPGEVRVGVPNPYNNSGFKGLRTQNFEEFGLWNTKCCDL